MWFKRFALSAALLLGAISPALPQAGTQFPAGTVWGNSTAAARPGRAETVTAILDRAFGSTRGSILIRGASGWTPLVPGTVGLPFVSAGAGADPLYQILTLAGGGTGAALTASNGGIVYSGASAMAILAGTATAGQIVRSGVSSAPSWSTSTYPATSVAGTILASLTANAITATAQPVLGASGVAGGQVTLNGSTSGSAVIKTAAAAGTVNFQLPTTNGASTNVLQTDGSGNTSWAAAGAGTVTNVATAGLATGGPITGTGTVTVTAATKAEQETGTSTTTAVTPANFKNNDGSAKAWGSFTGSTGVALATYNVTGNANRTGAGQYVVTFTTAFATANYSCSPSVNASTGIFAYVASKSTTTVGFTVLSAAFGAADPNTLEFVCYGRQ